MKRIQGLEGIVRNALMAMPVIAALSLSACGYIGNKPEPTSTLPPPQMIMETFTPTASPYPTFTPTVTPTSTPAPTSTPPPTATPMPVPTLPYRVGCKPNKEIIVDLSEQKIYATLNYCNDYREFVNSSLVSTGTAVHPTPLGDFEIIWKLRFDDMGDPKHIRYPYFLKDVPFVMYFTNQGHAIHGTYWHHNFGHPMSHGCVNLPTNVAEWFYNWAPEHTLVRIQP